METQNQIKSEQTITTANQQNMEINNKVKSDLPIQSGNSVPARDSEYLLPENKTRKIH